MDAPEILLGEEGLARVVDYLLGRDGREALWPKRAPDRDRYRCRETERSGKKCRPDESVGKPLKGIEQLGDVATDQGEHGGTETGYLPTARSQRLRPALLILEQTLSLLHVPGDRLRIPLLGWP